MAAQITIVAGPARSGKTERLLAQYRRALVENPSGAQLWIAPNFRAATEVANQVLKPPLTGCLAPGVLTFNQLGHRVLAASRLLVRSLAAVSQRELLARLVDEARAAGELAHFAPIAETSGFLDLLARFIRELKRLEIWPHELAKTCGPRSRGKERGRRRRSALRTSACMWGLMSR